MQCEIKEISKSNRLKDRMKGQIHIQVIQRKRIKRKMGEWKYLLI